MVTGFAAKEKLLNVTFQFVQIANEILLTIQQRISFPFYKTDQVTVSHNTTNKTEKNKIHTATFDDKTYQQLSFLIQVQPRQLWFSSAPLLLISLQIAKTSAVLRPHALFCPFVSSVVSSDACVFAFQQRYHQNGPDQRTKYRWFSRRDIPKRPLAIALETKLQSLFGQLPFSFSGLAKRDRTQSRFVTFDLSFSLEVFKLPTSLSRVATLACSELLSFCANCRRLSSWDSVASRADNFLSKSAF